jgi:basic amino acid/polyamine antiporter, APA family
MDLFRRKSVTALQAEAAGDHSLKRALGPVNLTALGIGAIIGTGIFVLTGTVAAQNAGPAVILSFVFAGIASALAALCYSEFASLVPMAGSAYTYGYATLGEFIAWIIGWDLVLEYALSATTVAIGWSGYVVSFLADLGIHVPAQFQAARGTVVTMADGSTVTALFNIPAVLIIAVVTTLLVVGIKESASVNNVIVVIKLVVVVLFIALAAQHVDPENWKPFIPENTGSREHFGFSGVVAGAAIVFFAYIGFDAVSTAAQEAKNPQRDMPIGILGSLAICTFLYVIVSAVLTGIVHYSQLGGNAPVADAMRMIGAPEWIRILIDVGAVLGLASVIMVMLLGQSRVFYSMSRDGLIGKWGAAVHPRFRTPYLSTVFTGVAVGLATGVLPLQLLGQLVNIGTLLAFVLVCAGVWILRGTRPDLERPFKTPLMPFVPIMGILCCFGLMMTLPGDTWLRLIVWLLIGFAIYFGYGRRNSVLQRQIAAGTRPR